MMSYNLYYINLVLIYFIIIYYIIYILDDNKVSIY